MGTIIVPYSGGGGGNGSGASELTQQDVRTATQATASNTVTEVVQTDAMGNALIHQQEMYPRVPVEWL